MKIITGLSISFLCISIGLLYFAIQHNWIMVQIPFISSGAQENSALNQVGKKTTVHVWYYNHGSLIQEPIPVLWYDYIPTTVRAITQGWLAVLEEAGCCNKKIAIESVIPSQGDQEINISFTRNLFDQEESIMDKLLRLEGLLKTLRENKMPYKYVRFLVHHQPMYDPHIDLSYPWPITGFMAT